jgi:hypothetical protein
MKSNVGFNNIIPLFHNGTSVSPLMVLAYIYKNGVHTIMLILFASRKDIQKTACILKYKLSLMLF